MGARVNKHRNHAIFPCRGDIKHMPVDKLRLRLYRERAAMQSTRPKQSVRELLCRVRGRHQDMMRPCRRIDVQGKMLSRVTRGKSPISLPQITKMHKPLSKSGML